MEYAIVLEQPRESATRRVQFGFTRNHQEEFVMANERHIPTIDDLIALPQPDDAQISPDGTHVVYTVTTPDWKQNDYISQLWLVAADGQANPRQLTFAQQSSNFARWSADGQWLAFLSKREGDKHSQIYRLSPFGGEAERLTEMETDARSLAWSPDGQHIAYVTAEAESEKDKKRQETYGDYHVEDEDYDKRAHLWLLRLSDKKCRKLTSGQAFHVTDFDWHPAGDRLAFCAVPTPDARDWDRGRLYTVDLATLNVTPLTPEGCETPRWSPDGSQLAFTRNGTPSYYANNQICTIGAAGGDIHPLAVPFDENIWLSDWAENGIYFEALQQTTIHLFRLDLARGNVTQLTPQEQAGWASLGVSFTADFTKAALIGSDAKHYAEVCVLDLVSGSLSRLTNFNEPIRHWPLGSSEVFSWTSLDGTPIEGVLTKPANFDPQKEHPLLVVIHGGPSWAAQSLLLPFVARRLYPIPLWTAKDALILQPNYRGSSGYGEAFRALNVRNLGLGDYEDVISGVDALITQGWVDPARVGAMGWSQGGYISAFITTYSDRFKAVSVGAGISNWVTYYVNTDIHPFTRYYLAATPWDEMEIYQKTSPMTYIKQARTPTLIQHGQQDRRVPAPNAYELYQGLQDVGVTVKLVLYPGMPHGPNKPRQSRQIMQDNLAWFNRWLWDEEPEVKIEQSCYIVLAGEQQRPDEGPLPAIERYTAAPVHDVYHWARRDQADFRILSGQFGLLSPDERIDQDIQPGLAAEDVSATAARLAAQLKEHKWPTLLLYTAETRQQPSVLIALGCLQVAAGMAGNVKVEHREVTEKDWSEKDQG
jgi:dipeptidyl aminopeptidase/acylaminoacyl peptidase